MSVLLFFGLKDLEPGAKVNGSDGLEVGLPHPFA
jgi:hypothetical protein